MYELHKKVAKDTHYWKVWQHRRKLHIESGVIGVSKNEEEVQLSLFENGKKHMERLAKEKMDQGFEDGRGKDELIIVVHNNGTQSQEELNNASFKLYDMVEKEIEETGIGFCDGLNIEEETQVKIYCYVNDIEIAVQKIQQVVTAQELIEASYISLHENNVEEINLLQAKEMDVIENFND